MPNHVRTRAPARQLPAAKPVQLPLPGIEPLPRYPLLVSLPDHVRATISRYRYPLLVTAAILFLLAIGQGFAAGAIACGAGLYLINQGVDKSFGQYLDKRGNSNVR